MKSDQLQLTGERKSVSVEMKVDDEGHFEAIFSTFNVIDHDGDVTLPGAFEDGAAVIVGAYGHSSWGFSSALPVGKGVIEQTKTDARVVGEFFLNTESGKEHHAVVKALGKQQEWSYGFDVKGTGDVDDLPVELQGADRVLTKLEVFEVSPVLKGAGIDTQTVVVKNQVNSLDPESFLEYVRANQNGLADIIRKAQGGEIASLLKQAGIDSQGGLAADIEAFNEYLKEHKISMPGAISGDKSAAVTELARFELFRFSRMRRELSV